MSEKREDQTRGWSSLPRNGVRPKVTPQHLCRLFREVYGTTPIRFLAKISLQKAKEQLIAHPEKEVSELVRMVGFDSHSYFTSVFAKREQLTPTEFRRSLGFPP